MVKKKKGVLQGVPAVQLLHSGEQHFNRKCVKLAFLSEGNKVKVWSEMCQESVEAVYAFACTFGFGRVIT